MIARDLRGFPFHSVAFQRPGSVMVRNCSAAAFRNSCTVAEGSLDAAPAGFPSESRNTIRLDDAIEALRLTHDNRIIDTTR